MFPFGEPKFLSKFFLWKDKIKMFLEEINSYDGFIYSFDIFKEKPFLIGFFDYTRIDLLYNQSDLMKNNKLRKDKDVILKAIKKQAWFFTYASDELKNDKEVVIEAVKNSGYILEHVPTKFQNDKVVVLAAVNQFGFSLKHASNELKNDKEVVLAAANTNVLSFRYASDELKKDPQFSLKIVKFLDKKEHVTEICY
jgi:hypothetical protein